MSDGTRLAWYPIWRWCSTLSPCCSCWLGKSWGHVIFGCRWMARIIQKVHLVRQLRHLLREFAECTHAKRFCCLWKSISGVVAGTTGDKRHVTRPFQKSGEMHILEKISMLEHGIDLPSRSLCWQLIQRSLWFLLPHQAFSWRSTVSLYFVFTQCVLTRDFICISLVIVGSIPWLCNSGRK